MSRNEGLRVPMGGCPQGADAELRAAAGMAAEPLRAEGQSVTLAAGAHADVIMLDGDPREGTGLLADPAAHMPLVIQADAASGSADP